MHWVYYYSNRIKWCFIKFIMPCIFDISCCYYTDSLCINLHQLHKGKMINNSGKSMTRDKAKLQSWSSIQLKAIIPVMVFSFNISILQDHSCYKAFKMVYLIILKMLVQAGLKLSKNILETGYSRSHQERSQLILPYF